MVGNREQNKERIEGNYLVGEDNTAPPLSPLTSAMSTFSFIHIMYVVVTVMMCLKRMFSKKKPTTTKWIQSHFLNVSKNYFT